MSVYLRFLSDTYVIKRKYQQVFGHELRLDNPQTFNEKIQWLKLNKRIPILTQCADKLKVREIIESKIGAKYLIPLHFTTKNEDEIIPQNLPDTPHIIKTNHDSSGGEIVYDKSNVDWNKIQKRLNKRLGRNYYKKGRGREWAYKNIEPCIIVEQLLQTETGKIPNDYKLHCFNGKVEIIQVDLDRFESHRRNLYNVNWELLPFKWKHKNGPDLEPPKHLKKMIELSETLAHEFEYVRVDWYHLEDKIYFGELTFYHENGLAKFKPGKWDLYYGQKLRLNING